MSSDYQDKLCRLCRRLPDCTVTDVGPQSREAPKNHYSVEKHSMLMEIILTISGGVVKCQRRQDSSMSKIKGYLPIVTQAENTSKAGNTTEIRNFRPSVETPGILCCSPIDIAMVLRAAPAAEISGQPRRFLSDHCVEGCLQFDRLDNRYDYTLSGTADPSIDF
jgi:hypothetical protein